MSVLMEADPIVVVLRQTEAIPRNRFESFLADLKWEVDSNTLLQSLHENRLLTSYQLQILREGRIAELGLGTYRILDKLGDGATGTVFLAEPKQGGRQVALKVLNAAWDDADSQMLARFRREAQAAALLEHPNIVKALDLGVADGKPLLVMEYVEGKSLEERVTRGGPAPLAEAVDFIRQAALGLEHIHESGLVHRDIKPSNVLLTPDGQIKILDLGLARFTDARHDDLTARQGIGVLGTLDYMAPEQTEVNSPVDIRADIYGLGGTFYFLLTGQPPLPSFGLLSTRVMALQFHSHKPLREFRADVDDFLEEIINLMLAKSPANRFATPSALLMALDEWLKEHPEALLPKCDGKWIDRELPSEVLPALPKSFLRLLPVSRQNSLDLQPEHTFPKWLLMLALIAGVVVGITMSMMLF